VIESDIMKNIFYLRILLLLCSVLHCGVGDSSSGPWAMPQMIPENSLNPPASFSCLSLPLKTLTTPMMPESFMKPTDRLNAMIASRLFANAEWVAKSTNPFVVIEILQNAMSHGKNVNPLLLESLKGIRDRIQLQTSAVEYRPYDIANLLRTSEEMKAPMQKQLTLYDTFNLLMEEGKRIDLAFFALSRGERVDVTDLTDLPVLGEALVAEQIRIDMATPAIEQANDALMPSSMPTFTPGFAPMPPIPPMPTFTPEFVPMPPMPSSMPTTPEFVPMPPMPSSMPTFTLGVMTKKSQPTDLSKIYLDIFHQEFLAKCTQQKLKPPRLQAIEILLDALDNQQYVTLIGALTALKAHKHQYNKARCVMRGKKDIKALGRYAVLNCITRELPLEIKEWNKQQVLQDTSVWTKALRSECYWIYSERMSEKASAIKSSALRTPRIRKL